MAALRGERNSCPSGDDGCYALTTVNLGSPPSKPVRDTR
jgi:hypothetical protein